MKDSRGNARPRASIPSPLSTYSISTDSLPELAARMVPRALPRATVHHGPKTLWQSAQPPGGQSRIVSGKPNPRVTAGDYYSRYFPYRDERFVNDAHDFRDHSRRNTDLAQNMHQRQIYRAYAPRPSLGQSERVLDDHRTTFCLGHVDRPNNQTLRALPQLHFEPDLTADPAASRGFPILADRYRLDYRPSENVALPERNNSHPHTLRVGQLKPRHASMAMPEAITDPELTGSTRLKQSFEIRRRVREPRSAIY